MVLIFCFSMVMCILFVISKWLIICLKCLKLIIIICGLLLLIYGFLFFFFGLLNWWDSYLFISFISSGVVIMESVIVISNSVIWLFWNKCCEEVVEKRIKVNLLFWFNMLVNCICFELCMLYNCASRYSMRIFIVISIIMFIIIYNRWV